MVSTTEPMIEIFHPKKNFITMSTPTNIARLLNACFSNYSSYVPRHARMLMSWMNHTYPGKVPNATR
jgi:hypothetical protein